MKINWKNILGWIVAIAVIVGIVGYNAYQEQQKAVEYKNNHLYRDNKQIISNEALVAITILTAESNPDEMEIIVRLIMNLLS